MKKTTAILLLVVLLSVVGVWTKNFPKVPRQVDEPEAPPEHRHRARRQPRPEGEVEPERCAGKMKQDRDGTWKCYKSDAILNCVNNFVMVGVVVFVNRLFNMLH